MDSLYEAASLHACLPAAYHVSMLVHAQMCQVLQAYFCLQAYGRVHIIAKPYKPSVAVLQIFGNSVLLTTLQSCSVRI